MEHRAPASAITLTDLTVAYDGHVAIRKLSGDFAPGSLTAVVGPNGAGKTSLLATIMGTLRPVAGRISIASDLRRRIAWLPQQSEIDRTFPIQVFDLVALGHWARAGGLRALTYPQLKEVHGALQAVDLTGLERRPIGELSTGQFQRVLFARVLLQDASVILLDEPFNAIDERTTLDLLSLIARWHAEGRTVIAVLHAFDLVREHFQHTLLLARQCVAWGETFEVLTAENLVRARRMAEGWEFEAQPTREKSV